MPTGRAGVRAGADGGVRGVKEGGRTCGYWLVGEGVDYCAQWNTNLCDAANISAGPPVVDGIPAGNVRAVQSCSRFQLVNSRAPARPLDRTVASHNVVAPAP
ncbi:hypothetical protein GCM10010451_63260 [Streptomyces virens]|uniref:Uncharacterized protein n=1 Tax=Streptomyces virens TaxID=285572 RepID=A0ABP6Q4B6_9ACTN